MTDEPRECDGCGCRTYALKLFQKGEKLEMKKIIIPGFSEDVFYVCPKCSDKVSMAVVATDWTMLPEGGRLRKLFEKEHERRLLRQNSRRVNPQGGPQ